MLGLTLRENLYYIFSIFHKFFSFISENPKKKLNDKKKRNGWSHGILLCCIQDIDYNIIIYEWIENCVNIICSRKILKFLLKLHCSQKPQKRRWFCVIVEQFHMNGNLYSQLAWLRSSLSRKLQPHVNILHLPRTFQPASFQNKFNLRLFQTKNS